MTTHREFLPTERAAITYKTDTRVTTDDPNGHGTHTASIAGGALIGAAPKAAVSCLRVLDSRGSATYSDILSAMSWLGRNAQLPAVMSMSFGGSYSKSLNDMTTTLVAGGLHAVVAMGNSASNSCKNDSSGFSPASAAGYSSVISVGSSSANDSFSRFSNYGTCMTISAPGDSIIGAWPKSEATNTYAILSGTSMATPFVSGVVARFLAKYPNSH